MKKKEYWKENYNIIDKLNKFRVSYLKILLKLIKFYLDN